MQRYTDTIRVNCPFCKAKPGKPCVSWDGPVDYYHLFRKELANDTRLKVTLGELIQNNLDNS